MLVALGVRKDNIIAFDRDGVIFSGRPGLDPDKARYASDTDKRSLAGIVDGADRSEEHTSELQSLMRISYAVFCLKKTIKTVEIRSQYHTRNSIKQQPLNIHST